MSITPSDGVPLNTEGIPDNPVQQYEMLKKVAGQLSEVLSQAVIEPIAKKHFEMETGQKVTQVLPDRTSNFDFEAGKFSALVLPDERTVTNQSYAGNVISTNGFVRNPEQFSEIITDAEELWVETFGKWRKHVNQTGHPGPFPLADTDMDAAVEQIVDTYNALIRSNSIELVVEAARDDNHPLLAGMFNTDETEMLTPGGDDLSALARMANYSVPYNDGNLALIAPETSNSGRNPAQRGVIVGHDDTPVGIFAHVTDVTNLDRRQQIGHGEIRSAMGFDRELDPWSDVSELTIATGERVRLQGDLRVERVNGDVESFADELARNTRQERYTELIESAIDDVTINGRYIRGRRGDLDATDIFSVSASEGGEVVLDPQVSDAEVELLGYATILVQLDTGPAIQYDDYDDIPYVVDPWQVRNSIAVEDTPTAVGKARDDVQNVVEAIVSPHRTEIEAQARETGAEVKAAMTAPQQVNLPVDNHLALIEAGFAPDVDTEPVPVAIPEPTTLVIEHREHNTVNLTVNPGVYRFSLLPRGLQPAGERPEW